MCVALRALTTRNAGFYRCIINIQKINCDIRYYSSIRRNIGNFLIDVPIWYAQVSSYLPKNRSRFCYKFVSSVNGMRRMGRSLFRKRGWSLSHLTKALPRSLVPLSRLIALFSRYRLVSYIAQRTYCTRIQQELATFVTGTVIFFFRTTPTFRVNALPPSRNVFHTNRS